MTETLKTTAACPLMQEDKSISSARLLGIQMPIQLSPILQSPDQKTPAATDSLAATLALLASLWGQCRVPYMVAPSQVLAS